jgi:hypothetical protein
MRVLGLILLLLVVSARVEGQESQGRYNYDGNEVYGMCTGTDSQGKMVCLGFVAGVMDAFSLYGHNEHHCYAKVPFDIRVSDAEKVVVQYIDAHPELRNSSGFYAATLALQEAYPCTR